MASLNSIGMRCLRLSSSASAKLQSTCKAASRQASSLASSPDSAQQQPQLQWKLASAVCLERLPTLTPELTSLQRKVKDYYEQLDLENSLKSDHELRHLADLVRAEKLKEEGGELEAGVRTALDDEDAWDSEYAAFVAPTVRKTEADASNDLRSLNRALDRPLHLVVQQEYHPGALNWQLPQNLHRPGETMRQTAERALFECVGDKLKIQFLGNAPWAFYNHVYSKSAQEKKGVAGEKVFIFKAFHLSGEVELKTSKDYQWLLREELKTSKLNKQEKRALFRILYNEK